MGPSHLPRSVRDSELQVHTVEIPMLLNARTSLIVYSVCTNVHTHAEARRTTLGMPRTWVSCFRDRVSPWPEPIKLARLTSEPQGVSTSTALGWAEPQHSQPFKVCAGDEAERSPQPLCCGAWLCCLLSSFLYKTKHTRSPSFTEQKGLQEETASQQGDPGKNERLRNPCNEIKPSTQTRSPTAEKLEQTQALFQEGKG